MSRCLGCKSQDDGAVVGDTGELCNGDKLPCTESAEDTLMQETGCELEDCGDGVSGSQNDSGGTGGIS